MSAPPLLRAQGLEKSFPIRAKGGARSVRALRDVSMSIAKGEIVALVGESGSGKSTLAKVIARLVQPDAGALVFDGDDVLQSERRAASLAYRRRVQMVFQDPFGSLNPVHRIGHHIARPLLRHGIVGRAEVEARVHALLESVGLVPPDAVARSYPHALSGGQRQRVSIARALAVEPELLVADEPTSMLDVSIRMDVLNLLRSIRDERGVSILLVTHDLASARYLADRIFVLYAGGVAEEAPAGALVDGPAHPYTQLLLDAVPRAGDDLNRPLPQRSGAVTGRMPERGCAFAPRCPKADAQCEVGEPPRAAVGPHHFARCLRLPNAASQPSSQGESP